MTQPKNTLAQQERSMLKLALTSIFWIQSVLYATDQNTYLSKLSKYLNSCRNFWRHTLWTWWKRIDMFRYLLSDVSLTSSEFFNIWYKKTQNLKRSWVPKLKTLSKTQRTELKTTVQILVIYKFSQQWVLNLIIPK